MASIAEIDGLTVPAAAAFLLDTYANAEAAFSVRRLSSQYTGACMRVRRASDNVEGDIGFDSNNELSLTSPVSTTSNGQSYNDFGDFVGHGATPTDGFVRWWYDQSQAGGTGSGNDAGIGGALRQPKIYDATTGIIEEGSVGNEKPALYFDGTKHIIYPATFATNIYYSFFSVKQQTGDGFFYGVQADGAWAGEMGQAGGNSWAPSLQGGFNGAMDNNTSTNTDWTLFRKNGAAAFTGTTTRGDWVTNINNGNQHLIGMLTNGTPLSTTSTEIIIGSYTGPAVFITGNVQEVIMFQSTTSNESSNASGIENNINGYFNIYP